MQYQFSPRPVGITQSSGEEPVSEMDSINLWQTFLTKAPYKENFKDVLHPVEIVLILPISAGQCEHVVSAQNGIKSNVRATSIVEGLIRLSSEGPPVLMLICITRLVEST